ncbi:voltage-gated potassium channel [Myriangium duriaei CBS 260.36]|uniref:Voltage-gated potassium channel n=1 Tax=Myriangium duriaei CBS 260.36 TaxID=1168546 RepID=A0A9P4MEQ8_9PEZI|nr:voltage-gated potassium channel [Myriangium duriaei CBS 260.36]
MNDPGAETAIDKAEEEIEPQFDGQSDPEPVKKDREAREKQRHDYRDPSLWWFASTGCPLLAGTFGPLANAFSVCALVRSWRVYIPPGQNENYGSRISDPAWLLAINGLSLFFALIANTALLLNMSRRLRFNIAQPISVIGFFIAGVLLLVAITVFTDSPTYHLPLDSPAAPAEAHALTAAYYFAIQAAVIYFIVTGLMALTAWGAWMKHFAGGFRLTMAQRTLMLQTMSFVVYLLLGALIFSHLEGWEYLDALYWADLTLLTIGLGSDFSPKTHAGRTLVIFFAIGGIIIIGLVIGSIRTLVLDRGKRKLSARIMEKKRLRAINSVSPRKNRIRVSRFGTMKFDNDELDPPKRRELEFNVMRKVQACAERDRKWMALSISLTAAMSLWLLGALVFFKAEYQQDWTYFQTLYFTYICLLTIGYGDFYPQSFSGKAFFVLWTLLAVPTLTILISDMSDTVVAAFSNLTMWVGTLTVLPGEHGFRASLKMAARQLSTGESAHYAKGPDDAEHDRTVVDDITERLAVHLEETEMAEAISAGEGGHTDDRDRHFYHVVLAREVRRLMHDLAADPPKKYSWQEWEYFLRLMDTEEGEDDENQANLVPEALRQASTIGRFKKGVKAKEQTWTWLGQDSPLLSYKSETEWVLERLGTTLENELQLIRLGKDGERKGPAPPVRLSELVRSGGLKSFMERREKQKSNGDV